MPFTSASQGAFTQARKKFLYTAFIELNQKAVVELFYYDQSFKKYREFRLLGIDGSTIILPDSKKAASFFGTIKIKKTNGKYCSGRCSVLYDVLNNIAIR